MAAILVRNTKTLLLLLLPQTPIRLFSSSPTPPNTSQIAYSIAKTSIQNQYNPNLIAEPYLNPPTSTRSSKDTSLLLHSIKKLFAYHQYDLIQKILEQQKERNLYGKEQFWVQIILLYSNHQMLDQSVKFFQRMGDFRCVRTQRSFSAILNACFYNGRFDLVHRFFVEIPLKIGVIPDVDVYEWVLKAFVAEKKMKSALCLLRNIEKEQGLEIYISTYNVLLNGYLKYENYEKFDEVYKEIIKKGLKPNLVCYNLRITRLCKIDECIMTKKLLDELTGVKSDVTKLNEGCIMAMKLLDEMVSNGVKPNITSYNTVITGFCKIGDLDSADSVLKRMCSREEKSVSPNKDTYFILLGCMLKEGEFEAALEICRECIEQNWVPHFSVVQDLVKGLVKLSRENEAKEIVESVKMVLNGNALEKWQRVEVTLPLH